jgi:hypothetical protein
VKEIEMKLPRPIIRMAQALKAVGHAIKNEPAAFVGIVVVTAGAIAAPILAPPMAKISALSVAEIAVPLAILYDSFMIDVMRGWPVTDYCTTRLIDTIGSIGERFRKKPAEPSL